MGDFVVPRVNYGLLHNYIGNSVRLVGKVVSHPQKGCGVLQTSDNGQVNVLLNDDSSWSDAFVEVIGKVNQDLSISAFISCNFGNNFDLNNYDEAVKFSHQYNEIFM